MNLENEEKIKIKAYSFTELAVIYSADRSKKNATTILNKWIKINKKLRTELKKLGYDPCKKGRKTIFTPKMVKLVFENLNPPEQNYRDE